MDVLTEIQEQLYAGAEDAVVGLVRKALEAKIDPEVILHGGLIAGMEGVGRDFRDGTLFMLEVLFSAKAMQAAMDLLKPLLDSGSVQGLGRFVIGTVKGDIHDIGKNLVAIMMEGAGFEVVDLGVNVSAEQFVAAVEKHRPALLGLSSLLTTTMDEMRVVVQALERAGLRSQVKVIVGGAPVSAAFASEIGADGYAANAGAAVTFGKQVLSLS